MRWSILILLATKSDTTDYTFRKPSCDVREQKILDPHARLREEKANRAEGSESKRGKQKSWLGSYRG